MIPKSIQILLILCLSCLSYPLAWADERPQSPQITRENDSQPQKIAILPKSIPVYLYKNTKLNAQIDPTQLKTDLYTHIAAQHCFAAIDDAQIDKLWAKADLSLTDAFMQAELDMAYAQTSMADMDYSSAIKILKRIIENYQKSHASIHHPLQLSKAWQQLAYAYIAQYQEAQDSSLDMLPHARHAFIELIRLAPSLTMLEGRQSKERVTLYDESLELFMSNPAYRQTTTKDAQNLAQNLQADTLLFTRIVQNKLGAISLEIDAYHAKTGEFQYHNIPLNLPESPDLHTQTAANEAIQQLELTCTQSPKPDAEANAEADIPKTTYKFAIEFGALYTTFLAHPTRKKLHGLGGHLSFLYMFDEHFFIRANAEIIEILQDKAHELHKSFEIYQFPILLGISKQWQIVRIYGALGLNFSFFTPHIIVHSTTCKTFGLDDIECHPDDVTRNQDPFSLQVAFAFGINIGAKSFYATLEALGYVTAYPIENRAFKHPLGARIALQYWF